MPYIQRGPRLPLFFTLSCVNVCRKCYNTDKGVMIMIDKLSDDMKKLFLLGIGAAAVTAEKARDMVDYLVEKGELSIEQGKVLNEEL